MCFNTELTEFCNFSTGLTIFFPSDWYIIQYILYLVRVSEHDIPRLIINQFKWLDKIVHPKVLNVHVTLACLLLDNFNKDYDASKTDLQLSLVLMRVFCIVQTSHRMILRISISRI